MRQAPPDPGIKNAYAYGWDVLKASFWILLGLSLLYGVVQGVGNSFIVDVGPGDPFNPVQDLTIIGAGSAWSALVVAPTGVGLAYAYLKAARGQEPEAGDIGEGFRHYLDTVVAMLLAVAATMVGFVLLIVPGIIVAIRLSFTGYILADEKLPAIDALKASWARTEGHSWEILGFALLAIPFILGGLLLLVIGVVPALMWIGASFASYYRGIMERSQAPGPGPGNVPEPQGPPA